MRNLRVTLSHAFFHFFQTPCVYGIFYCIAALIPCIITVLLLNNCSLMQWRRILCIVIFFCAVWILFASFVFLWILMKISKQLHELCENKEKYLLPEEIESFPFSEKICYILAHYSSCPQTKSEDEENLRRTRAELFALQAQINPHFLYNTLDSIRGQALIDGVGEIAEIIEALSNIFKYSIGEKDNLIPLRQEIENLLYYIKIQKYRYMDKINMVLEIEDNDYQILRTKIPKLTLQPIVENAIHHGLEPKVENGTVTIRVFVVDAQLQITVADDGVGMDEETLLRIKKQLCGAADVQQCPEKAIHGIALYNANKRIQNYFGSNYGIEIYSTKGVGTRVDILFPF